MGSGIPSSSDPRPLEQAQPGQQTPFSRVRSPFQPEPAVAASGPCPGPVRPDAPVRRAPRGDSLRRGGLGLALTDQKPRRQPDDPRRRCGSVEPLIRPAPWSPVTPPASQGLRRAPRRGLAGVTSKGWGAFRAMTQSAGSEASTWDTPLENLVSEPIVGLINPAKRRFAMFGSLFSSIDTNLFDEFRRLESEMDQLFGRSALPAGIRAVRRGTFPPVNVGADPGPGRCLSLRRRSRSEEPRSFHPAEPAQRLRQPQGGGQRGSRLLPAGAVRRGLPARDHACPMTSTRTASTRSTATACSRSRYRVASRRGRGRSR